MKRPLVRWSANLDIKLFTAIVNVPVTQCQYAGKFRAGFVCTRLRVARELIRELHGLSFCCMAA